MGKTNWGYGAVEEWYSFITAAYQQILCITEKTRKVLKINTNILFKNKNLNKQLK